MCQLTSRTRTACLSQLSGQSQFDRQCCLASANFILKDSHQTQSAKLLWMSSWLIHTLRKNHIELRLCADNWKIMKLMTDNYPQWQKYHTKKRSSDHMKAEQDLEDESIADSAPLVTQKRRLSEPDNECSIKRSCVDSEIREVDLVSRLRTRS
jgi:hypothetical protein